MKITDIKREEGTKYVCSLDNIVYTVVRGNLVEKVEYLEGSTSYLITDYLTLFQLLDCDFEEVFNWSSVVVDTKVYVRESEIADWNPRHFAYFEGNVCHVFYGGATSFTTKATVPYKYCKLAE